MTALLKAVLRLRDDRAFRNTGKRRNWFRRTVSAMLAASRLAAATDGAA